jgi:hypothetical protein
MTTGPATVGYKMQVDIRVEKAIVDHAEFKILGQEKGNRLNS